MFHTALVFSGIAVDLPGATPARFPQRMEEIVEDVIKRWVGALSAQLEGELVGLSQAARGSEILFLEICRDLGLETRMVLPAEPQAFVAASVAGTSAGDWPDRFETLWDAHAATERETKVADPADRLLRLARSLAPNLRLLAYAETPVPLEALVTAAGGKADRIDAALLLTRFREAGL